MRNTFLVSTKFKFALYIIFITALLLACDVQQLLSFGATDTSGTASSRYLVKPNDTLGKIAQNYGVTVEQLIALNKDKYPELSRDPSLLKPGIELIVPNLSVSLATRAAQTRAAPTPGADLDAAVKQIIEKINVARAGKKLYLLREDKRLAQIALDRSADMIQRNYFAHYDPSNGQEPFLRYLQATNYPYQFAGENIAEVKNDAGWVPALFNVSARFSANDLSDEFVRGWLNSNEHRENIFNPRYTRTGVGVAVSADGQRIVATQVFSD